MRTFLRSLNPWIALVIACAAMAADLASPISTAQAQPGAVVPVGQGSPGLSIDVLKNAPYRSLDGGLLGGRTIQLAEGAGEGVRLTIVSAFGDLDGDGAGDAAAVLIEPVQGNNETFVLAAFLNKGGQPSPLRPVVIGNRGTTIQSLAMQAGRLTLNMLTTGPNDALCCPTQAVSQVFAVQGDQLVDVATSGANAGATAQAVPNTLTDTERSAIVAAVERANAAWATATEKLDPASLGGAVAGQELTNDLAELDRLRSQGQARKNVNTAFSVTDVTLDAPGHAIVRTQETWYAEIFDSASGQLVQRTTPTTYDETYTLEYQHGGWIVTLNDLS